MTDAVAAPEETDDVDQMEASDDGTDEQPPIDEGETAEVDLDALAANVEEVAGAGAGDEDDEDDVDVETTESEESAPTPRESGGGSTWGDMYVQSLTSLSNALIEEHGKPGAEPMTADRAYELDLAENFDQLMKSRGMREDMPPEQAVLLGTMMFVGAAVLTKTTLVSDMMEDFDL